MAGMSLRLAFAVAGLAALACQPRCALAQGGPAPVVVAPIVQVSEVAGGHTFVATVQPARRSVVGSAVSGRIIEFLVKEGDRVAKGQPLAQLLTNALEIQVAAARAELELRKHEHQELANGSREEEVRQAEAELNSAKAALEYAQSKVRRTQSLFERNAASQDQLQDDTRLSLAATHFFAARQAAYDIVRSGPRKEKIAQAQARVASAEEEVNRLLDQLAKHTIRSPFDGFVVHEHTEVGQWISAGELVADLVEVAEVDVEAQVLESYIPQLRLGSPARIEIGALPQRLFEGKVTQIVPQADLRSRSFPVKIRLKNEFTPDGQPVLKPGMFAKAVLPVESKQAVLMAPKDAIVMGGAEPIVYVVDADAKDRGKGKVRPVAVRMGVADGGMVEISGAISAGQRVVVEGNERLMPGREVVATERVEAAAPAAVPTAALPSASSRKAE